jgi:hypothetical protein
MTSIIIIITVIVIIDRVLLYNLGQAGTHYVAQAALKLVILLPQLPEYWDYMCALPHLLTCIIIITLYCCGLTYLRGKHEVILFSGGLVNDNCWNI